ncbi:HAMP domain-containing sensor histidine kinase [Bacillus halotolerans]|uniref:histidine kinase n=1 Tax=Bacillus halotolerans TaxID=260554 RepID=A0A9Q4HNB6_9BACI|nr:HAMP domain-containing sensor histidine kinase [Bacillus halotolerans]MCY8473837.1 HAMP domain-containing histidine kinase [Bacillus halotolerans]MCY9185335.1 HAMP domain-containing histidine kinase [Bacillus halotolerans]MCY9200391.1 HAMP domain-containing histidine kinase [Bacillus halotolerans]MEC3759880.1 HAMP domain-containing sensor histidine kinase [Bacillus halotolerans]QPZ41822.1 HAMP domain-containing histidine kinase [Bacillus halotolerans]
MKLKTKYQLLLCTAVISVPVLLLAVSILMSVIYDSLFKPINHGMPFHRSFAYPAMLAVFLLSLLLLAFLFSTSIHSLLRKINLLNQTIRHLASDQKVPDKIEVKRADEIGELIKSVNLLIERTTYRELELRQREEIKKELLQKLRHDINTPLTALRLQLFYLESQCQDQTAFESLYQQIEYIAELTNEFNHYSAETLESSYIVNDEVNISDLLETTVKKWDYLYSINGIELQFKPSGQSLIWMSNSLWIQRLFDNIFQNTLKHSKADKLEVTIENGAVSIRDDGIGFDRDQDSNGLGLKIIEDICRLLHISYELQTNENGTAFLFSKK